ncbi:hypothetical protein [Stutzerimonas nitrititolerans]|uniref:hypothetical protein n=1 Tax=Stutzerimonas nitrititolerans TaxID=2482751 RepID=UPI00289C8C41|nr:hypothetical protein [Stutzerimonas nitrititolerans]
MWKLTILTTVLISSSAQATFYTDEPDPEYQKITTAIVCMNHFYNRSSSLLAHQAGVSAQSALEAMLGSLEHKEKTTEAIRMASIIVNKPQDTSEVPFNCYEYIPKEHGLTQDEVEYFILNSTEN